MRVNNVGVSFLFGGRAGLCAVFGEGFGSYITGEVKEKSVCGLG